MSCPRRQQWGVRGVPAWGQIQMMAQEDDDMMIRHKIIMAAAQAFIGTMDRYGVCCIKLHIGANNPLCESHPRGFSLRMKDGTMFDALCPIPATGHHDAAAIARCSRCWRYSADQRTLGPSYDQPVCDCGSRMYWSGCFDPPGPDAVWCDR